MTKVAMRMIIKTATSMPMITPTREPFRVFLAAFAAVGTDEETREVEDVVVVDKGKLACGVLTITLDI